MKSDIKREIINLLLKQGYPTYAKIAADFEVCSDLDVETAFIEPEKYSITLGKIFMTRGDDFISLAIRHELSHFILNHFNRGTTHKVDNYELWNCAADAELSHYYTDYDREEVLSKPFMSGSIDIVLHPSFTKYKGWKAEDIYDDLIKDNPQQKKDSKNHSLSVEGSKEGKDYGLDVGNILEDIERINVQRSKTKADKIEISNGGGAIVWDKVLSTLFKIEAEYRDILQKVKKRTFSRENVVYQNSGLIIPSKKKERIKYLTIHCFRDVSGSMTKERTESAVSTVKKLSDNKQITIVEHTFSNGVDEGVVGGGTNYDGIVQYCKSHCITDIAIVTDDDYDNIVTDYLFNKVFIIGVQGTTAKLNNIKSKTLLNFN